MRRCSCCRLQSWKWNPCQLRWARCCGVWVVRAVARRSVDPFYTLYFFFTERKKENTEIQNLAQVQRSPPRDRECIPKRTSRDLGKFLDFWIGAVTASLPYADQFSAIWPGISKSSYSHQGSFTASRQRRRARGKISRPPARLQQDEVRAFPPALFLAAAPTLGFAAPAATLAVAFLRMCSRDARPIASAVCPALCAAACGAQQSTTPGTTV